ncbi:MAG: NADH-quinone oxidoreductase subunit A [Candidatus Latescibacteria bacterium]|jgi:NADH-quinone oxidoreductase subunit A|nr:NADH-quinone oxidoreductase subunit A [Candidatus Latescibacterota bacterium]
MVYLPLILLVIVVVILALTIITLSSFVGRKKEYFEKLASYECGVPIQDTARKNFSVKFYLIAILFILFDVEIIYMYPWAVVFKDLHLFGAAAMGVFFLMLVVGFVYEWKRGALEWD